MTREELLGELGVRVPRLSDPAYFADIEAQLRAVQEPARQAVAAWFLQPHTHHCSRCAQHRIHTGLQALRDGAAAHQCCGRDLREAS